MVFHFLSFNLAALFPYSFCLSVCLYNSSRPPTRFALNPEYRSIRGALDAFNIIHLCYVHHKQSPFQSGMPSTAIRFIKMVKAKQYSEHRRTITIDPYKWHDQAI